MLFVVRETAPISSESHTQTLRSKPTHTGCNKRTTKTKGFIKHIKFNVGLCCWTNIYKACNVCNAYSVSKTNKLK